MKIEMFLFLLQTFQVTLVNCRARSSKIDPRILGSISTSPINVLVSFNKGTGEVLRSVRSMHFDTRTQKLWTLHKKLVSNADEVQKSVKAHIENKFQFKSLWITNQLHVTNPSLDLIEELSNFPEVLYINLEESIHINSSIIEGSTLYQSTLRESWGVKKVKASESIQLLRDATNGNPWPVVVATIDTGVRFTHETLKTNFIGDYGWFDALNKSVIAVDENGHGTSTMGVIIGLNGIGVYPGASWMTCRACLNEECNQSDLLLCAQFISCPTLSDGSSPDCSKAPNIVSNSWSSGRGLDWFDKAVAAWVAGGIIPLFMVGNEGPNCRTASSPSDAISVGSTTIEDALSPFSSLGPTIDYRLKPDVSAPGSSILSAHSTSDKAYLQVSGTDFAVAHAAGVSAILLAYNLSLSMERIKYFLQNGVESDNLVTTGKFCGDIPDYSYPNNFYGFGRIDALNSLQKLIQAGG